MREGPEMTDLTRFLAEREAEAAKRPLAERVKRFVKVNEDEGYVVVVGDRPGGGKDLYVYEGRVFLKAHAVMCEGEATRWV